MARAWAGLVSENSRFSTKTIAELRNFGFDQSLEVCLRRQAKAAGRFNGEHRNETAETQKLRKRTGKVILLTLIRLQPNSEVGFRNERSVAVLGHSNMA